MLTLQSAFVQGESNWTLGYILSGLTVLKIGNDTSQRCLGLKHGILSIPPKGGSDGDGSSKLTEVESSKNARANMAFVHTVNCKEATHYLCTLKGTDFTS